MDPRGTKRGGMETHLRLILAAHPADFSILLVGIDECGDCQIGEVSDVTFAGQKIAFLPVLRVLGDQVNQASKTLLGSLTLRYGIASLRYRSKIAGLLKGTTASADLQRYEFALLVKMLRLPSVVMIHNEGAKDDEMDSVLKRYWFVHSLNERIAVTFAKRVYGVNPNIVERVKRLYPSAAKKTEVMSVSIDTNRFAAQPFDCADGIFRICFAGRLDTFKDPHLMFGMLRDLHERLGGKLEFHYAGPGDPYRYPEFAAIESYTVRHGSCTAEQVATIMAHCHAGVLTSYWEGMPCYLLETLSIGRPVGAIRLPQYDPLIVEGVSGTLIERTDPVDACRAALVDAFATIWDKVQNGSFDPACIHALIEPYSVDNQMMRLFACHRELQDAQRHEAPGPGMLAHLGNHSMH
jgi:glycosyltransferase involved in cell wall biosynthesis